MISIVFLCYALLHLALFAWAVFLLLRHRHPSTVPLLIVTFGLIYDNAVLAAGQAIGHGELLERLSIPRFFMHAFFTPLLMLTALGLIRRAGADWARSGAVAVGVVVLTLLMITTGLEKDLLSLQLVAKEVSDLVSYGNAASSGPPLAPIVTILILIAAGVIVWRKGGGLLLLAGAVVQFIAAAVGDAVAVGGNLGEIALLAGLIATDHRLSVREDRMRNSGPSGDYPGPPGAIG